MDDKDIYSFLDKINNRLSNIERKIDTLTLKSESFITKEECLVNVNSFHTARKNDEKEIEEKVITLEKEIENLKGKINTIYVVASVSIAIGGIYWYLFKLVGKI